MSRDIRSLVACTWLWLPQLMFSGGWLYGQEPPHFRTTTNLILVDVRVLDRDNRPVQGLKAEDFGIAEEGVAQAISYFREVSLPFQATRITRTERSFSVPDQEEKPANPETPDKRLLIFLFDLSSAGLQDVHMMGKAAQEFLDGGFTSYDLASVLIMDSGLELLTDFTSDPITLGKAFKRLTAGDPELEVFEPDEEGSPSVEFVADETEFSLFQTNRQLSAIHSVADAFRDVRGRKALLYFSSGIRLQGVESDEQMRLTADACNKANVSVYSVDARGLVALSPGGGAQRAGGGGTSIFSGRSSLNQMAGLVESQGSLITLSADTGGAALVDDNDFSGLLCQAQEESSHYYLLGYYAPTPPSDGSFRRVEITTKVSYRQVVSRRGYYSDKPYRALTRGEKELNLLQAVLDDLPAAELTFDMAAEYFPDSTDQYLVAVLLALDSAQLRTVSGQTALDLEIVILARDGGNRARAAVRDRLQISNKRSEEEARFVYENLLVLGPGEYQLSAYIRDNGSGRMSKATRPLSLLPDGPVRLSSLVLAGRWEEASRQSSYRIKSGEQVADFRNPLLVGGRSLVPRVNASFESTETVYIHGTLDFHDSEAALEYRIVLSDERGETLYAGSWKPPAVGSDGKLSINARLPLAQLSPGNYRLSAELRSGSGKKIGHRKSFTVTSGRS